MEKELETLKDELRASATEWHERAQNADTAQEIARYYKIFRSVAFAYDDVEDAIGALKWTTE